MRAIRPHAGGIENVPIHFYDKAMLGLEGRDEQIANYQATIRNMGEAGIPILGFHWMPTRLAHLPDNSRPGWRTCDRFRPGHRPASGQ